jgi:hypothetical protein
MSGLNAVFSIIKTDIVGLSQSASGGEVRFHYVKVLFKGGRGLAVFKVEGPIGLPVVVLVLPRSVTELFSC